MRGSVSGEMATCGEQNKTDNSDNEQESTVYFKPADIFSIFLYGYVYMDMELCDFWQSFKLRDAKALEK